jgi:hypothetical protein
MNRYEKLHIWQALTASCAAGSVLLGRQMWEIPDAGRAVELDLQMADRQRQNQAVLFCC